MPLLLSSYQRLCLFSVFFFCLFCFFVFFYFTQQRKLYKQDHV